MQIVLDFKDDYWIEVLRSFCERQGYQRTIVVDGEVIRNPQSPQEFLVENIKDYIQDNYVTGRVESQVEQIRQQERDRLK